jgi:hypothetical protein
MALDSMFHSRPRTAWEICRLPRRHPREASYMSPSPSLGPPWLSPSPSPAFGPCGIPELDDSDFVSVGAFVSSAGAFVSVGAAAFVSAGAADDDEVVGLEELELPQPATPSATRTTPSATHRRGPALARPSDDFVSMRPPYLGLTRQQLRRHHHPKPSGRPGAKAEDAQSSPVAQGAFSAAGSACFRRHRRSRCPCHPARSPGRTATPRPSSCRQSAPLPAGRRVWFRPCCRRHRCS